MIRIFVVAAQKSKSITSLIRKVGKTYRKAKSMLDQPGCPHSPIKTLLFSSIIVSLTLQYYVGVCVERIYPTYQDTLSSPYKSLHLNKIIVLLVCMFKTAR